MKYKAYGYDSDGKWIESRKSRKNDRKNTRAYNVNLHSKRTKKQKREQEQE